MQSLNTSIEDKKEKSSHNFISNSILFLIVISYFELFKLSAIPISIRYMFELGMPALMVAMIILGIIYMPKSGIKMHFSSFIIIMLLSAIPSFFIASHYHNQGLTMSLFANRVLWFYLLYFYVHLYQISIRFIIRLIVGIGLFAVLLYYIQFFMYPRMIMDIHVLEGRGTIRLFVAGMLCTQFAYFYFLNRFFSETKIQHLILSMLCLSTFILQGTRQLIGALIFLTLVNLLLSNRVKSKGLIALFFSLSIVALFFIFREIFMELTRVSTSQASNVSGGIRLHAAKFYLFDFMPHPLAYIFGNTPSAPGTLYSQRMVLYSLKYGYYTSDIGVLGDYIKYGIVFTITGLLFLAKSLIFKVDDKMKFMKYYIASQCFTLAAGYGILGGVDIIILLIIYMFDLSRHQKLDAKLTLT